ncbi:hypothetical protein [Gordonia sp. MP11Mi]|uniref:Uncharacterized protein n=1 Tax=Gordonia sp. MP11Mi TaxID=3022769 RepID=A0AA97D073_9ACTN
MSEERYFDEHGNELTPEEVAALGDYEIVEEVEASPAAQQPAAETPAPSGSAPAEQRGRVPKALLAGAAAVVVLIGGGVAYGMQSLGQQNTAQDVKQNVAEKSSEVKAAVEDKKEEVLPEPSAEPETVRTGTRVTVTGAACLDPAAAQWDGEGAEPEFRLRRESAAKLPASITTLVKKRHRDRPSELSITQPKAGRLGVYASDSAGIYSRANVSIVGGVPVVLSSEPTPRVGKDAGECPTLARATTYAVVDGSKEKSVEILASKSVGDVMYGVTDGEVIELVLERVDEPESDGGDEPVESEPEPAQEEPAAEDEK